MAERNKKRLPLDIGMLLFSVVLVCLPHLLRMPPWISLLCLGLIGWRLLHETGRAALPGRYLRLLILGVSVTGLFLSYATLFGRTAGSALLLLMLCLKLMELKGRRDVVIVIYISFFILITGFLFDQSIYSGLYMLLVVLSLITTLILHNHPAATGRRLPRALGQTLRQALMLMLQALPLTLMLFFLFPRLPGPLWSLPDEGGGASTGLSDELEPGRISKLSNNPAVAFRVKFEGPPPPAELLYWRGPVLSLFDGRKWKILPEDSASRLNLDDLRLNLAVDYTLTLEPHNQHWLFALELPGRIPANTYLSEDMQLLQTRPVTRVSRYRMRAYLDYRLDPRSIINSHYYLQVPDSVARRTRRLVAGLRRQHAGDGAFVNAALNFFREENFIYTRQPPALEGDAIDGFLFDSRRGYCTHYASALAVMLRLAGIPARIVSGYQGGEMNPLSDYMIVRQSDAHAWVEAWLPRKGWLRLDPTSVIPDSRVEDSGEGGERQQAGRRGATAPDWLGQRLKTLRYAWDRLNNDWNNWVVGYNEKRQKSLLARFGAEALSLQNLGLLLAAVFALGLLVLTLFVFRRRRPPAAPVKQLYARFCRKLARLGFVRRPEETARDYARRVSIRRRDLQAAVMTITRAYDHLRYAPHPSPRLYSYFRKKIRQFRPPRHYRP